MHMLAEDIRAGGGDLAHPANRCRKVRGRPQSRGHAGKVIFETVDAALQYAPSTPSVLKVPLLIVPPGIKQVLCARSTPEKILHSSGGVGQGLTVFVISWVNPTSATPRWA